MFKNKIKKNLKNKFIKLILSSQYLEKPCFPPPAADPLSSLRLLPCCRLI